MARRFGKIQRLQSGNYRASFVGPDGGRQFAAVTFPTEADAEMWLAAQRTDILRETWKAPRRTGQSVQEYSLHWVGHRTDLKPRTMALYVSLLNLHILPALGDLRIADVSPIIVREWYAGLASSTGPTARAQSYRLLRTILNQAMRDGELDSNPCQIRNGGTVVSQERPAPTLAQVHQLADRVPARYRTMVLVAAYGGLRFGELTALTRADVTVLEGELPSVTIRRAMHRVGERWVTGTPKSDAGRRTVALPPFMSAELVRHLDKFVGPQLTALVFATASGRPLARSNWTATFGRARGGIGLKHVHFHDLRHAAATLAVQSGATLKDTMARLGHSSARAALIYQHAASDRDAAIAMALDRAHASLPKSDSRGTDRRG